MTNTEVETAIGLLFYKQFVDSIRTARASDGSFAAFDESAQSIFPGNEHCTKEAIIDVWISLSSQQKAGIQTLLEYMWFEEQYQAIARALRAFLPLTIRRNGVMFPHMPYGKTLLEDWQRRSAGEAWTNVPEYIPTSDELDATRYRGWQEGYMAEGLAIYKKLVDGLAVLLISSPPSVAALEDYIAGIADTDKRQAIGDATATMSDMQKLPIATCIQYVIWLQNYNGVADVMNVFSHVDLSLNGINLPRSPFGEFILYDWTGRSMGYGWEDDPDEE